jgi:hypothetical protein
MELAASSWTAGLIAILRITGMLDRKECALAYPPIFASSE